jgi:MFS family permease
VKGSAGTSARRDVPTGILFLVVCSVLTIDAMAWGVVVPFLPERARDLGASTFEVTLVYAAYSAGLILFTVPAGIASDRLGRRPIIIAGGLGMAAATVVFALAGSVWLLGVSRFLQGVTGALWWAPGLAVIADLYPAEQRGARLGLAMSIIAAGDLAGPAFGGALTELASYRLPLFLMAAACIVTVSVFAVTYRNIPQAARRTRADVREVLFHPIVLVLCLTALMASFGIGMLHPLLPLHLADEFDAGPAVIGFVFTTPVLGFLAAGWWVGRLSDRIGRARPIVAGVVGCALTIPLSVIVPAIWMVGVVILLVGFFEGTMQSPSLPFLAEVTETDTGEEGEQFGAVYGIFDTSFALGGLIGPVTAGALLGWVDLKAVLAMYSAVLLLYAPLLWWRLKAAQARHPALGIRADGQEVSLH